MISVRHQSGISWYCSVRNLYIPTGTNTYTDTCSHRTAFTILRVYIFASLPMHVLNISLFYCVHGQVYTRRVGIVRDWALASAPGRNYRINCDGSNALIRAC